MRRPSDRAGRSSPHRLRPRFGPAPAELPAPPPWPELARVIAWNVDAAAASGTGGDVGLPRRRARDHRRGDLEAAVWDLVRAVNKLPGEREDSAAAVAWPAGDRAEVARARLDAERDFWIPLRYQKSVTRKGLTKSLANGESAP
ncbi:hypothetical protein AB0C12_38600 [Actinoplanes sp. NPDC048967]|uniref:hypothetical protein n=1 Tax=Actinoplanes sp. NPDC048967 TaxID=3155269 RepID=UPI0033ECAA62